jgi:hypothetical protein
MFKRKQVYFWPIANNNKKIIVEEFEKKQEFKNIIKREENLD